MVITVQVPTRHQHEKDFRNITIYSAQSTEKEEAIVLAIAVMTRNSGLRKSVLKITWTPDAHDIGEEVFAELRGPTT